MPEDNKSSFKDATAMLFLELQDTINMPLDSIGVVCDKLTAIHEAEVKELVLEKKKYEALLSGRAGKLLKKGKPFIVIANDEPYFWQAYDLIKAEEMSKGTWTERDEVVYLSLQKGGEEPTSEP